MSIERLGSGARRIISLTARRRWLLRAGFATLLVLLGVAVILAYQIQRGFSAEATHAHQTYIQQEEALFNVRRSLWQSSIVVRDLLLDASPDREAKFVAALALRKKETAEAVINLQRNPIPGRDAERLNAKLDEFWMTLAAVPATTRLMSQAQRYAFVQNEVTNRRVVLSELAREVAALGRSSVRNAQSRLDETRQSASRSLLGLVTLALVAGVVFAGLSLRRLNAMEIQIVEQYDEVLRTKAELQALSNELMTVQETERARLSRELHDEIGQALATLRLELARLESSVREDLPDIHGRLSRSRAIVDSTVKVVRNISQMLRPALLDDLGLVAALQWLAEDYSRRTGVRCLVRGEENVSDSLPAELRTCVYRVAQEAVHNVEKHANARSVLISVSQAGDRLEITVDDDGCGLEPGDLERWKTGGHLGILGMRERVAALEGQFEVLRSPAGGTRVLVRLPLPPGTEVHPIEGDAVQTV